MDKIPPLDLTQQYQQISVEVNQAIQAVLASGRYVGGSVVEQFEQQFAAYTGVETAIGCNSGTDALFLALRALEIGPGDQVITTPFTFIATAATISAVGATPVFVDIEAETFNLDLSQVDAAITDQTRAILPVHLFGQPTDMTQLMAIAQAHQLAVIEDCAQATGATWQGQRVGSIGQVGCFSFYPTKNLGAIGDGGAVTTSDPRIAARIQQLKDHGQSSKYCSSEVGINSRLDALQAAILQIKLRYLDTWNAQRGEVAQRYHQLLASVPEIVIPTARPQGKTVWHQYSIRVLDDSPANSKLISENGHGPGSPRNQLQAQLKEQGISSTVYYPVPLHLQPLYQTLGYRQGSFPIAERICNEVLSLPMFPELSSEQQHRVATGIQQCFTSSVLLEV
ncbi:MAG: DegT/DnrJ/EryC1/StrS family aminotransferase [Microcoleaceae cyanobacterium]